jgi:hypothetical protein
MPNRLAYNQRRALEMLAGATHGLTETTMFARGFAVDVLAGRVLAGLATVVQQGRRCRRGPAGARHRTHGRARQIRRAQSQN